MKILKKLLLINWHYFTFEVIHFDNINFLTGKTGSGKTTIIDAMQLLFLGDTTGHFFNKSASEKSNRNLKGYLRCEFSDNEDGSALYLRNGRFSSYIVCEFFDDFSSESFTIGSVFDNYEDTTYDTKFFIYDGKIPDNHFLDLVNVPLDQKSLRNFLFNRYPSVYFYETNISYREALKVKLGNLNNSFFSLFKKAIPFSPISNIETFITEYVCDVKSNIDVIKMQENIRSYKSLEIESQELQKRIQSLQEINGLFEQWFTLNETIKIKKYLLNRYDLYSVTKRIETYTRQIDEFKYDIDDKNIILEKCKTQIEELKASRDRYIQEKYSSDVFKKREAVEKELQSVAAQLQVLESKYKATMRNISLFLDTWMEALDYYMTTVPADARNEKVNSLVLVVKTNLLQLKETALNQLPQEKVLMATAQSITDFQQALNQELYSIQTKNDEHKTRITLLNQELVLLNQGQKTYDSRLVSFRNLIETELQKIHGSQAKVHFLADLMDIRDDTWRDVIESYLALQRFYLVVDPIYVEEAIQIYDRFKTLHNLSDFGIIDTEKVLQSKQNAAPNALSQEIKFKNEYTKAYVESLIGTLIKCHHVQDLRKNTRSITKDGMLYQGFVARQMNLKRTTPFIGTKANAQLVTMKIAEKQELLKQQATYDNIARAYDMLVRLDSMSTNEIKALVTLFSEVKDIPLLHKQQQEATAMLHALNDNYLDDLEKRIKDTDVSIRELEQEQLDLTRDIVTFQGMRKNLVEIELPKANFDLNTIKDTITKEFQKTWIIEKGEPAFIEIIKDNPQFANQFTTLKNEIANTIIRVQKLWNQLVELRSRYNSNYHISIDTSLQSNRYYQEEFADLHDVKLFAYKSKIAEAKELAIQEFKSDFLAKLKNNFDSVISQIKDLNSALSHVQFGEDSYEFIVTPRPEYKAYYAMINDELLISGKDISSDVFYDKYRDTIEDLFRQITFIDTSLDYNLRGELEKNIEKFTDYRSYLKFDLLVKSSSGSRQSLARTLQKKSGGETQTPFYIAVLASFGQAYRTHLKNDRNATIRLIIFDEAFSKMDAERIIESVKLLRTLGLQAIIAAPPEKMPDITPLVDTTHCVIRSNTISTVKAFKDLQQAPEIK